MFAGWLCSVSVVFLLRWFSEGDRPNQFYDFILSAIRDELDAQALETDRKGSSPFNDFIFIIHCFLDPIEEIFRLFEHNEQVIINQ